jgi:hypothetical protein
MAHSPRPPLVLVLAALALAAACGGGGTPSSPATPAPTLAPATIAVSLVDGDGAPVEGATLKVDGIGRAPRSVGGSVFDLERGLVGHALDVERDGYLVHQALVPERERRFDLFEVPADASKTWIQNLLYDGVINRSGRLARLTRGVSIVRGASVPEADWARARDVLALAADRMGGVTGFPFQVVDEALPGTVSYRVELDPSISYGAYFEWRGTDDVIERATVAFRTPGLMSDFSLVLHELTHGFGLSHSDRRSDVMHPAAVTDTHSDRELLVISSVKRRPPGTSFEDNVRTATGALSRTPTTGAHGCGARPRNP